MSYDDVWELSQAQFTSTVNSLGFNHWEAYMKLNDQTKILAGIEAAMAQGSRRTRLVGSQSLSSSGPTPTDLTESVEAVMAATKGKGKTKGSAS